MKRPNLYLLVTGAILMAFALACACPIRAQEPMPGYWTGWGHQIPCNLTKPYTHWVDPGDGTVNVMQYPVTVLTVQPDVEDGTFAGQGGSDHTTQYWLDGMIIPLRSGVCDTQPLTCPIYGAPYRDVPVAGQPSVTLCDKYVGLNPPGRARPCPSNETASEYAQTISQSQQFRANWAANAEERRTECAGGGPTPPPQDTPTPRPGTPTRTLTRTKTPTAGPCVPGAPCQSSPTPTVRPPTPTLTSTSVPLTPAPGRTVVPPSTPRPSPQPVTPRPTVVATARPTASRTPTSSPTGAKGGCLGVAIMLVGVAYVGIAYAVRRKW